MKNIIIVCGLPISGKSYLAEGLARKLHYLLLSVDPIESAVIQSGVNRNFVTGLAAYKVAESVANENLRLDNSVIIDAVSGAPEAKQMWRDLAEKHQTKLIIIECSCSDEAVYKKRVETRVRNIPGIPEVTWQDVSKCKNESIAWE